MQANPEQDPEAALVRQDAGADAVSRFFCGAHFINKYNGVCPVCRAIEEKDRDIAILQEKIQMLQATLEELDHRPDC